MNTPSLRAVGARLEEASAHLPGEPADSAEVFERYESVAISILDLEHIDFPPGVLQEYLPSLLYTRQLELGLIPFFRPARKVMDGQHLRLLLPSPTPLFFWKAFMNEHDEQSITRHLARAG